MADPAFGQKLSDSSREIANIVIGALKQPGGIHPPTAIAGCARMAGTLLFRSFDLELSGAQPGQPVLSAPADEHCPMLLRTTAGILAKLGITLPDSPPGPLGTEGAKPLRTFLDTQRLLEPLFIATNAKHGFTHRQAAQAAAVATALLVHHFSRQLEPVTAFGIAALAFTEGCKTVPDPPVLERAA